MASFLLNRKFLVLLTDGEVINYNTKSQINVSVDTVISHIVNDLDIDPDDIEAIESQHTFQIWYPKRKILEKHNKSLLKTYQNPVAVPVGDVDDFDDDWD